MRKQEGCARSERWYIFFLCLAGTIILFSADWMPEYASDTYATYVESLWELFLHTNGRLVNVAIYYLFEDFFHAHQSETYIISYWMGILFLTLSVFVLARRLDRDVGNWVLSSVAALFIIANLYIIEYFLFVETGLFMLAIFLSVLAFDRTVEYFETGKGKFLLCALVCLLAVVNIYQIIPGFYVVLCLPYILRYADSGKRFCWNNLIVAGLYGLAMGASFFVSRYILAVSRVAFTWDFRSILRDTIVAIKNYTITSGYIGPRWFYVWTIFIPGVLVLYFALRKKQYGRALGLVYLGAAVVFTAFFPNLSGITTDHTPRVMYPFGCLPGLTLLYLLLDTEARTWVLRQKRWAYCLLSLCFAVQLFSFNKIFIQRYQCNENDRILCESIYQRIQEYEQESGNTVTTIHVYEDAHMDVRYQEMAYSKLIWSAMEFEWSDVNAICVRSGRYFRREGPDDALREYFAAQDWKYFSEEQMIFDGDSFHWCKF